MLEQRYIVTRFCCTSGQCIYCKATANGTKRKRIVHARNVPKDLADRMVIGWRDYDPKVELDSPVRVPDPE